MIKRWLVRGAVLMVVVPLAAAAARRAAEELERRRGPSALTKGLRFAADKGRALA